MNRKEPTMNWQIVAVIRMDIGYQVALTDMRNKTLQLAIEDEEDLLKVLREVITGEFYWNDEEKEKEKLVH